MKLTIDPMPSMRQAALDRVDAAFDAMYAPSTHLMAAHAQKRQWAETGDQRLKPEADLRGISVDELAQLILAKPNDLAERELKRMALKLQIRAATTPQELDAITP